DGSVRAALRRSGEGGAEGGVRPVAASRASAAARGGLRRARADRLSGQRTGDRGGPGRLLPTPAGGRAPGTRPVGGRGGARGGGGRGVDAPLVPARAGPPPPVSERQGAAVPLRQPG